MEKSMKKINVQLLLTGNELMSGEIVDSNSAMMAQELKSLGIEITKKTTIADDMDMLVEEIKSITNNADILIINGGLGPTVDDLTAQALAKACNTTIEQHPLALEHLQAWCKQRNATLNKPHLKQAMLPKSCQIIANRTGSAVGFQMMFNDCQIFCTPGVPHELKVILKEQIIPLLSTQIPEDMKVDVTRLQIFGLGESNLQKLIDENLSDWPETLELGFRAGLPLLEVKVTSRTAIACEQKDLWLTKLKALFGDHLISEVINQPLPLAEHVLTLLKAKKLKITTAESCTGGLIASLLTKNPGSSAAFEAAFITYSNKMKSNLLDVESKLIEQHGAVSQATVIAMAKGALKKTSADLVIAVSGVAGPTGGTPDKPIGTVWIAWGSIDNLRSECLCIPGNRTIFQHYVSAIGLDLIRRILIKSEQEPIYIVERRVNKNE
jgi:nicotinamide-nucleotide amidase